MKKNNTQASPLAHKQVEEMALAKEHPHLNSIMANCLNQEALTARYSGYFGIGEGGPDLPTVLTKVPTANLETFVESVRWTRDNGGRVFFIGNGGSYDNARHLAIAFDAMGIPAATPGADEGILTDNDYVHYFANALTSARVGNDDLVVGLSGSGNSPNILAAFETALSAGARCFSLGGRDGGKMVLQTGLDMSVIAATPVMETIEDVHLLVGLAVAQAVSKGEPPEQSLAAITQAVREFATESNMIGLQKLAHGLISTIFAESTAFIGGIGVGARHFRADAQRGFTNAMPIRGLFCPEPFTTNSGMATANDDGTEFLLVDGFAKQVKAGAQDFAVLFALPGAEAAVDRLAEWCDRRSVPWVRVGGAGCNVDATPLFRAMDPEVVPALFGHATGVAIRYTLWEQFGVRKVDREQFLPVIEQAVGAGALDSLRRKLTEAQTEVARGALIAAGVIQPTEAIMFAYGEMYVCSDPERLGMTRVVY